MYELLETIDTNLSNKYRIVDGEKNILYVQDRETGKHFKIIVKEIIE